MRVEFIDLIIFTLIYIIGVTLLIIGYKKDRPCFTYRYRPERTFVFVMFIISITILWLFGIAWIIDSLVRFYSG